MAQENILVKFDVDYTELTNAQAELAKTGKVDTKGFEKIQTEIKETATETKELVTEFKNVATVATKMGKSVEAAFGSGVQDALDTAGVSVDEFAVALKKANAPATSLKKELKDLKESMSRMKAEGKDTGKEFDSLRQRAGKLSDAIADANAEIKNAGSDTKNIDNVVGSISALAGGYAAVQGAAALFGDESEDLQKTLVKVNAAMAIASGIQQVMTALQKEGALAKLADVVATKAQAAATTLYTFVMAGATTATKVFRAALISTGIGAVVVLIGYLITAIMDYADEAEDAKIENEKLKASFEATTKAIDDQIDSLNRAGNSLANNSKAVGQSAAETYKIQARFAKQEEKLLQEKFETAKAYYRKLATTRGTDNELIVEAKQKMNDAENALEDNRLKQQENFYSLTFHFRL